MTQDSAGLADLPGRYRSEGCAPGSEQERKGQVEAGWRTTMLRLRFCGVYLSVPMLRDIRRVTGLLVTTRGGYGDDRVEIIDPGSGDQLTRGMTQVEMLRMREDGSMLLRGQEWDEGGLRRWNQTWLCCPDAAGIDPALQLMQSWLGGQYAAAKAAIERPTKRWPYV
ncbi:MULTISPECIES: hypothetical protein [Delftia]|uniref:hypothetical protein n=1 Tax=Delftia TaxID=80865 RepID=UPI000774A283|nr:MULTISPECIES: hypothetical protein [Delftia]MPT54831.1 hypothetical protein [Delftia sp.]SFB21725.1 hypothetical protein SAMN05444579_10368 [Delftia tsuruhatensis]